MEKSMPRTLNRRTLGSSERRSAATHPDAPITFHPLTPARWKDFEALFGPRGACAACWCMFWKLSRPEWTRGQGAGNKCAIKKLVGEGDPPGILAYIGGKPAAWCSFGPR